jgi:hypothetical protein
MNKLTLTDLWLVLHNMAEARAAAVAALPGGDAFQGELGALRDKLGAIPGVRAGGRPLSVELSEADATHDTFGRALDLFLRAYEALAEHLPAPINEAVAQARAQVLPTPSVFALSYQDEAIAAQRRAPALEALGDQLALLPVAELGDLREVAARFQGAGQQLQALLQERADAESAPAAQHGALRHHALALLGDMRQALALQQRNQRRQGTAPTPDLREGQLFGYLNALIQMRTRGDSGAPQEDVVLSGDLPLEP